MTAVIINGKKTQFDKGRLVDLPSPTMGLKEIRLDAELRRPGHPGTAVQIGEDLFEVVSAEKSGGEWVYRLEPWPEQETIRVCVEWGEKQEREFIAGLRDDQKQERKKLLAFLVKPVYYMAIRDNSVPPS
jgi:hypothetical protein